MTADPAAHRAIVAKLARGPLLSRLFGSNRRPLKLVAVPRDHVQGDRRRGDSLLAGRYTLGNETFSLTDLDFGTVGTDGPLAEQLQGFSWLRDLAASASREKGARLAESIAGRWLISHGSRVDSAWRPDLWGERMLYWTAYAPYLLSSRDSGYRSALLNTMVRGARHLESTADKAPPGLDRITAWSGLLAASLLIQGSVPKAAKAEAGLSRALFAGQFDDGGLISRTPYEQMLLVDRLGLLRSAYFAARQDVPEAIESASAAAMAALHGVILGDGALSSWQGGNSSTPARINALIEGCGMRARPLRQPRGWGYHRLSALGTIVLLDAAPPPPPKMAPSGCASTLAFELSDGTQRLVINCGGPGSAPTALPDVLVAGLRTTAAHSTLTLDDSNSTAILDDGLLGKGVANVTVDRAEDNDSSRIEASHDGYARGLGMIHRRTMLLGNDGKELRGTDELIARGRRKIRGSVPYAIRFHLAPSVEAVKTADGMGAILRAPGIPPWNFRCRGGSLEIEESICIDGEALAVPTSQLVVAGDVDSAGGEFAWHFRRSS